MVLENAIVPIGPLTRSNSATVSPKDILKNCESITKKVAMITAIRPSPIKTFDVFLWNDNFNEENAPIKRANIVKYITYSFIKSPITRDLNIYKPTL